MSNSKLQLQANDNYRGENHSSGGFSLEFDYVNKLGKKVSMLGVSQDSEEDNPMSPLEAMGSNFAKAIYEMGWQH